MLAWSMLCLISAFDIAFSCEISPNGIPCDCGGTAHHVHLWQCSPAEIDNGDWDRLEAVAEWRETDIPDGRLMGICEKRLV